MMLQTTFPQQGSKQKLPNETEEEAQVKV